jgi:hypothetical protein
MRNEDRMNLASMNALNTPPCLDTIGAQLPKDMPASSCLHTFIVSSAAYSEIGMLNIENNSGNNEPSLSRCTSTPREAKPGGGKLGTWMLVGLIYYAVSGGPLGLEIAIKAGGPFLTLIGFTLTPIVWSCSEVALTTELSIAYPEASGYCAWLNAAFGPYSSFLCSSLHYVSSVLDNALYPVS